MNGSQSRALPQPRLLLFRLVAVLLLVALVGVAGEVSLRLSRAPQPLLVPHYDPAPLSVAWIAAPGGGRAPVYHPGDTTSHCYDRTVGSSHHWDREGQAPDGTPVGCVSYRIAASGFRDALGETPAGDRIPVAVLGDSFTFGEGVTEPQRFTERLSESLERTQPGRFQIRNRGVQGANLDTELNLYRARVSDEHPRIVVYAFVPNDAQPFLETLHDGTFLRATPWRMPSEPLWRRSRFLDWLSRRFAAWLTAGTTVDHIRASFEGEQGRHFDASLEALANETKADGARLVILVFPMTPGLSGDPASYPFGFVHEHLDHLAERLAIPHVDLYPSVASWAKDRVWVHPTDPHPSPELHALAAEKLEPLVVASSD